MGSRGLSSKGSSSGKTPTKWELNNKNAGDYGITLKERNTKKVILLKEEKRERLNTMLSAINEMNTALGLSPELAPKIVMEYGGFKDWNVGGDTNIVVTDSGDAVVKIYANDLFNMDNFDTGAHEYVHALEAWWINANYDTLLDKVNAWVDSKYYNGSEISYAICENAAIRLGEITNNQILPESHWKSLAGTIPVNGNYAQTNPSETIAVAVQDVLRHHAQASPYSKAIFEELKATVKDTQRRLKNKKSNKKHK